MHQEHNIPWNKLASHFQFLRNDPHRKTGFFARHLLTQTKDLNYFAQALAKTITAFAETEHVKYKYAKSSSSLLFSDELRDRYPEHLDSQNQRLDYWISCTKDPGCLIDGYGGLADVIKILMNENEILSLLTPRNTQIPLRDLQHLGWGHHFGFCRVAESALDAYIFFNLVVATGNLEGGEYMEMDDYPQFIWDLTHPMDYDAQQLPHRAFFDPRRKNGCANLPEVHHDLLGLREYLKTLFRLLYRYNLLLQECGLDPKWESEIIRQFHHGTGMGGVKMEEIETEDGWISRLA